MRFTTYFDYRKYLRRNVNICTLLFPFFALFDSFKFFVSLFFVETLDVLTMLQVLSTLQVLTMLQVLMMLQVLREHLPKKNVFFRALPEWGGGEGLARIKKYTLYIPFWRPKKMNKLPERGGGGEGGEVIRAMPERKHSFFKEVFPYIKLFVRSTSSKKETNVLTKYSFRSFQTFHLIFNQSFSSY